MDSEVVIVKTFRNDLNVADFFKELDKYPSISNNFLVARLGTESIKDHIREYLTEHGLSQLFHFSLTCDAVLHPGIHVDEIERLILGHIAKLRSVKNLIIIDQYIYTDAPDTVGLLERMIAELSVNLETVTFITNGTRSSKKSAMHDAVHRAAPSAKIMDIETNEFHDRFWIDADNDRGVVIGTSLNGILNKICLIDHLSNKDARKLSQLARQMMMTA